MAARLALAILVIVSVPYLEGAKKNVVPGARGELMYIASFSKGANNGIFAYRVEASRGSVTPLGLAAEISYPSFLTVDQNGNHLYAVNGDSQGQVSAYEIDHSTGHLKLLNQVSSHGGGTCYVSLDRTGHFLFVANFNTGSIAAFRILSDGQVGDMTAFIQHQASNSDPKHQAYPHWVEASPNNLFVLSTDLGLDEVLVDKFDAQTGTLTPNDPPYVKMKGAPGPRHVAFSRDGRWAYLITETASTITAFEYDPQGGVLRELQTVSTLPPEFAGKNYAAEIAVGKTGKFLYGSNRGHDSIAVFSIDTKNGKLTPVEYAPTGGKTPRNFQIDPSGKLLLAGNQGSNDVAVFRVDQHTGRLTPTGQKVEVGSPVCIVFVAAN